jgi:hypothetical protein
MSITGLDVFDSTVHQTNAWLKAIMGRLGTETAIAPIWRCERRSRRCATGSSRRWRCTSARSCRCWCAGSTTKTGTWRELPRASATRKSSWLTSPRRFRKDPEIDPERIARAVLATLAENIDPGQVNKIVAALPHELRELWSV